MYKAQTQSFLHTSIKFTSCRNNVWFPTRIGANFPQQVLSVPSFNLKQLSIFHDAIYREQLFSRASSLALIASAFADPAFAFSLYCSIILASFVGLKNSSIQSACFLASNFPHFHRYDSLKSALYIHAVSKNINTFPKNQGRIRAAIAVEILDFTVMYR